MRQPRLLDRRQFHRAAIMAIAGTCPLSAMAAGIGDAGRITDCRGRSVTIGPARRIASIGGTITETLYALGAADRIVAVDITSTWPAQALREKKSLGYMRAISAEGVLSLRPDLILAMNDAGPPTAMDQLVASPVPVVFVESTPSTDAIRDRTRFLARVVGAQAAGEALSAAIDARFSALATWRAAHPRTPRILFVMRMTNGHPLAAGSGTAADAVIRLAGATNAGAGMQGYKIVEDEALLTLRPDIVLTMAQDAASLRAALLADPGFRLTPAGQKGAIIAMEGERLLGFGPRTPDAALDLARMIDAAMPA
ncbi:iron complex transport system substrate-binding protein [Gluconacetobacter liquefaciens]|uniref:Iron complex transport system substrate-binding protein n=2 Tax=Gluconacetobacter liquefaciens TaxID=89584 RepID=A0A370G453_GLULI|nr:ABC transporter substrate-binding protein [Gluconacetobacter liquefaciens]RDI38568.1 iron complex transport system substrate-binding protein [Gluconacetobacter liquefaciens]